VANAGGNVGVIGKRVVVMRNVGEGMGENEEKEGVEVKGTNESPM